MASVPRNITNIQVVSLKSRTHKVSPNGRGYFVTSGASGSWYYVKLDPIASCTCKWAEFQPKGKPIGCSHVQSVVVYCSEQDGYTVKARAESDDVAHLHRKTLVIGNGVQVTMRSDQ